MLFTSCYTYSFFHTCFQPLSKMTCISSTRQYSPGSFSCVNSLHVFTLLCTRRSLNHGVVVHLNIRFCHIERYIYRGDMLAYVECIALYAVMLYPTLTLGLRKTPLVAEAGLSAWIRQHSDPSTWNLASESSTPRNLRLWLPRNVSAGIATMLV